MLLAMATMFLALIGLLFPYVHLFSYLVRLLNVYGAFIVMAILAMSTGLVALTIMTRLWPHLSQRAVIVE